MVIIVEMVKNIVAASTVTIYIPMALYSSVLAYYRLTRPGMSEEIREMFIRKHISYVTVYVLIWTINLSSTYYDIYLKSLSSSSSDSKQDTSSVVTYMSMIAAMCTGFILALIRTREPYFSFLIKRQIKEYFGFIMSKREIELNGGMINDTVGTFLTSSLNVELVHIILLSI